jgi:hypothetical protein
MKYYFYKQESHGRFSVYQYFVIVADEPLLKFDVFSPRKSFNCALYTEDQVLDLIQKNYPDAIQYPQPLNNRWKNKTNPIQREFK